MAEAAKQKQYDAVIQQGEAVRRMYPEYVGDANAYEFMAVADLAKGDKKAAAAVLTDYEKIGGEILPFSRSLPRSKKSWASRRKLRRRWTASTTSTRSMMKICIVILVICGLRRQIIRARSASTPQWWR